MNPRGLCVLTLAFGCGLLEANEPLLEGHRQALPEGSFVGEQAPLAVDRVDSEERRAPAAERLSEVSRVHIDDIVLQGNTVLDAAAVEALFSAFEGREVALLDLQQLRLDLNRMYVQAGYVSSGVRIPDQVISDGQLVFEAVESGLSRIDLLPGSRLRDSYILERLHRYIGSPVNTDDLQLALQRLKRDERIDAVDARLQPGAARGESRLALQVTDARRFHWTIGFDNHRASSIGAESPWVAATVRNLTGFGEILDARVAFSEGATVGSAGFSVPLNARDTTLAGYFARSDAKIVEDAFDALDIESLTDTWGVSLSHPLLNGLNRRLTLSLGFESKTSTSKLLGERFSFSPGAEDGESDSRAAYLSVDWLDQGSNHVFAARGTYRRGLDVLGASRFDGDQRLNPTGADSEFDLYLLQGLVRYRLKPLLPVLHERAQLVFRTTAQITWDGLMSVDKIALGGNRSVRGYPENLLVRDNGAHASLEVQLPIPGYTDQPGWRNLVLAPFIDYGRSWDEIDTDPISATRNTDDVRSVLSAGLGVLWQPLRGLNVQVYWGVDLRDNFAAGEDPRENRDGDLQKDGIHFSLTYALP